MVCPAKHVTANNIRQSLHACAATATSSSGSRGRVTTSGVGHVVGHAGWLVVP